MSIMYYSYGVENTNVNRAGCSKIILLIFLREEIIDETIYSVYFMEERPDVTST